MLRETRDEWVKALRSGEYEQGGGVLYDPTRGRFCCLGVLAAIDGFEFPLKIPEDTSRAYSRCGALLREGETRAENHVFMKMNDVEGKSFDEIADWIEENL